MAASAATTDTTDTASASDVALALTEVTASEVVCNSADVAASDARADAVSSRTLMALTVSERAACAAIPET